MKADIDGLDMLEADDGSSIDSKDRNDSPSGPLLARTSSSLKAEDLNEPSIKVGQTVPFFQGGRNLFQRP